MLDNLKIVTRLLIGFGLVLTLLLGTGGGGVWSMQKMSYTTERLKLEYKTVVYSQQLLTYIHKLRRFEKDIFLNIDSPEKIVADKKQYDEVVEQYNKRFKDLTGVATEPKEKELMSEIKKNSSIYLSGFNGLFAKIRRGEVTDKEEADRLMGAFKEATHQSEILIAELAEINSKCVDLVLAESATTRNTVMAVLALLIVTALAAAIFICFATARSIIVPLEILTRQADQLADGDLTITIGYDSHDEVGQLAGSFQRMAESLRKSISHLSETSSQVTASSIQLQSTAAQIAISAEEVAAQTHSVATASEEMSATSIEIARNCCIAAEAARSTADSAHAGAKVVQETITVMNTIAQRVRQTSTTIGAVGVRSEQIGAIIGAIEEIADQTNLLALNAAIEAARAGEQGRGFAVVADEVRALAERTTKATREISVMIKAIQRESGEAVAAMEVGVEEVENGALSSQKSGQALGRILERINEVSLQIDQIATAAEEQTATTRDISANIHQVTHVVHQAAHGAEETANAAVQLAGQAHEMQNQVRGFKL